MPNIADNVLVLLDGSMFRGVHTISNTLGGTRSCCSDKRKLIEDELCSSGESEDNTKVTSGFMK
jgi:hypothetical protein